MKVICKLKDCILVRSVRPPISSARWLTTFAKLSPFYLLHWYSRAEHGHTTFDSELHEVYNQSTSNHAISTNMCVPESRMAHSCTVRLGGGGGGGGDKTRQSVDTDSYTTFLISRLSVHF